MIAAALTLVAGPALAAAQNITGNDVRRAIGDAVQWLKDAQGPGGEWHELHQAGGTTALATLALINAGVPVNDPAVANAIDFLRNLRNQHVYTTALKIQVLAAADPNRYRNDIRAAAEWLLKAQVANGMWGYGEAMGYADYSNSQFALLGLHEADKAGAVIPMTAWRSAERSWVQGQHADGGWGYTPLAGSYGSMTSAGVASLYIVGHSLNTRKRPGTDSDGRVVCCGQYAESRALVRGLTWLEDHFSVDQNEGMNSWYFYYMYALERVGILSGQRFLGRHDWYREGATALLGRQRPDGSWQEMNPLVDTSFAILFLAKGHKPVLFNKLAWSRDGRWNITREDLNHLTSFIADRLGSPPTWEVVTLDDPLERWLGAPILYLNGNDFPQLAPKQIEKIQEYVKQGGTVLAVASCTGEKFREGFTRFAKNAFSDYELRRLPDDHPVFRMLFKVNAKPFDLQGIDAGCRTSVFYAPHDLACLWEYANVPNQSRPALELGTNLAAYATGLEPLPDRLDVVKMARPEAEVEAAAPRGAVIIAQLVHNGDWKPDPQVLPKLADYLHGQLGVDVVRRADPRRATDAQLSEHPILFMTGHFSFELTDDEVVALRKHIQRGGFLFAEACCGRKAFDVSFRKLMARVFPDQPLKALPADHPILAGAPGVPLPKVAYKPALLAEQPGLDKVHLEGIDLEGRTAVIFSPYGIGCGVDQHNCYACRGLVNEDALKLAGNIVLYALSY